MEMTSYAQKAASAKYDKENTIRLSLKLNKTTDADILEKLNQVESIQGYIKELIRNDPTSTPRNPPPGVILKE